MGIGQRARDKMVEIVLEKSANDIINSINNYIKAKPDIAKRRWVFELMQNALDVVNAPRRSRTRRRLDIEIIFDGKHLLFRHNGGPFTLDEITALICGGTTKLHPPPEFEYIGRFAKGFIVSHILSRKVRVRGIIEERIKNGECKYYAFDILIDRSSDDPNEIKKGIDSCFDQLDRAEELKNPEDLEQGIWTEYEYAVEAGIKEGETDIKELERFRDAVETGIKELERIVPFIIAFNEKIASIRIKTPEKDIKFERDEEDIERGRIDTISYERIKIKAFSHHDAEALNIPEVLVFYRHNVQCAFLVKKSSILKVEEHIPRIFKYLPLFGTEAVGIPFVINSKVFSVPIERDSLNDDENNRRLIEDIFYDIFPMALRMLVMNDFECIYHLYNFRPINESIKKKNKSFWEFWESCVICTISEICEKVPAVKTALGEMKAPREIYIPIPQLGEGIALNRAQYDDFYEIVRLLHKGEVPIKGDCWHWQSTLQNLVTVNKRINIRLWSLYDEIDYIKKKIQALARWRPQVTLVQKDNLPTIDQLCRYMGINVAIFRDILKKLYQLVDRLYQDGKVHASLLDWLLLDQSKRIGPKKFKIYGVVYSLRIEKENIPDKLKELAERIGYPVRYILLDKMLAKLKIINDLIDREMDVNYLLDELLRQYGPKVRGIDEKGKAWIELFIWCLINGKIKEEFPVFTKRERICLLKRAERPILLIPFNEMSLPSEYEDIFPDDRILHPLYFDILREQFKECDEEEFKRRLIDVGVLTDVIYEVRNVRLKRDKLTSILVQPEELEKEEHELRTSLTDIPFWSDIIGRVRSDPKRAKKFLRFIIEIIAKKDENWLREVEVECSCGSVHKIYPARWLAHIKSDQWVPVREQTDRGERIESRKPCEEFIRSLLAYPYEELDRADIEIENLIKMPHGPDILSHLGFYSLRLKIKNKASELGLTETELEKRLMTMLERPAIMKTVELLINIPDEQLEEIVNRKIRSLVEDYAERVMRNIRIGELVEAIIKEELEKLKAQGVEIEIKERDIGADIEIKWPTPPDEELAEMIGREELLEEGGDSGRICIEERKGKIEWPTPPDEELAETLRYYLEVKFTTGTRVRLSKAQAKEAVKEREKYIVLVVKCSREIREKLDRFDKLDEAEREYVKGLIVGNSHVVENIYQMLECLDEVIEKEARKTDIIVDVHGYWLKENLWKTGMTIVEWIRKTFLHEPV